MSVVSKIKVDLHSQGITASQADIEIGSEFNAKAAMNSLSSSSQNVTVLITEVEFIEDMSIKSSDSEHVIAPYAQFEMKSLPNRFAYVYKTPLLHQSMKDWITAQRELLTPPTLLQSFNQALSFVEAVVELHSRTTSFLVDLSLAHSIWVAKCRRNRDKGCAFKLMTKEHLNSAQLDRNRIYESYLSEQRGESVSLYPPEMVRASLAVDSSDQRVCRSDTSDSWAIGIIILLLLRFDCQAIVAGTTKGTQDIISKIKQQCANSSSLSLIDDLLNGIFSGQSKRYSINQISESILSIIRNESACKPHSLTTDAQIQQIKEKIEDASQTPHSNTITSQEFRVFRQTLVSYLIMDPDNRECILLLIQVLALKEKFADASELLDHLFKLNANDEDALYCKGIISFYTGEYVEAFAGFRSCLETNPKRLDALLMIACMQLKQNDNLDAIATLQSCLAIYDSHPIVLMKLAQVYMLEKQMELAAHTMRGIIHLRREYELKYMNCFIYNYELINNDSEKKVSSTIRSRIQNLLLAIAAQSCQYYPEAIAAYQKAIDGKETSNNLQIMLGICECYVHMRNVGKAMMLLEELNQLLEKTKLDGDEIPQDINKRVHLVFARYQKLQQNQLKSVKAYIQCMGFIDEKDYQRNGIIAEYLALLKQFLDEQLQSCQRRDQLKFIADGLFEYSSDVYTEAIRLEQRYQFALDFENICKYSRNIITEQTANDVVKVLRSMAYRQLIEGSVQLAQRLFEIQREIVHPVIDLAIEFDLITVNATIEKKATKVKKLSDQKMYDALLHSENEEEIDGESRKGFELSVELQAKAFFNQSRFNARGGDSLKLAKKCICLSKDHAVYWDNLAMMQLNRVDVAEYNESVKQCLRINPDYFPRPCLMEVNNNVVVFGRSEQEIAKNISKALICIVLGRFKKAIIHFQRCEDINANHEIVQHLLKQSDKMEFLTQFSAYVVENERITMSKLREEFIRFVIQETQATSISNCMRTLGIVELFEGEVAKNFQKFFANHTILSSLLENNNYSSALEYLKEQRQNKDATSQWSSLIQMWVLIRQLANKNSIDIKGLDELRKQLEIDCLLGDSTSYQFNFGLAFVQIQFLFKEQSAEINHTLREISSQYNKLCASSITSDKFKMKAAARLVEAYLIVGNIQECKQYVKKMDANESRCTKLLVEIEDSEDTTKIDTIRQLRVCASLLINPITNKSMLPILCSCIRNEFGHVFCKGYCRITKALAYQKMEKYTLAIKLVKEALQINPNVRIFRLILLDLCVQAQEYTDADFLIDRFEKQAIENSQVIHRYRGIVASKRGQTELAIHSFCESLKSYFVQKNHVDKCNFEMDQRDPQRNILDAVMEIDCIPSDIQFVIGQIASLYELLGQFNEAIIIHRYFVNKNCSPLSLFSSLALSRILFRSKCNSEAIALLKACLEFTYQFDESESSIFYDLGMLFDEHQLYTEAILAFKRCLHSNDQHMFAYGKIGDSLVALNSEGSVVMAEYYYRTQLRINKLNLDCFISLGSQLIKRQDESATAAVSNLIAAAMLNKDEVFKQRQYDQIKSKMEMALSCHIPLYHLVLTIEAADFPAKIKENLLKAARTYYYPAKDLSKAALKYEEYLALDFDSADIRFEVGCLYLKTAQLDKAKQHLFHSLKVNPQKYESYFMLSTLYINTQQFENAMENVLAGLQLHPTHPQGLANYGYILMKQHRFEEALVAFEECLHYSDGRLTQILHHIGYVYRKLCMIKESIACYDACCKIYPNIPMLCESFAQSLLADGQFEFALEILLKQQNEIDEQVMDLNIKRPLLLGEAYFGLHKYEEAKIEFENVISKYKSSSSGSGKPNQKRMKYCVMSYSRLFQGQIVERNFESLPFLKGFLDSSKDDRMANKVIIARANYVLANVYVYLGDFDRAYECIEQCLRTGELIDEVTVTLARHTFYTVQNAPAALRVLKSIQYESDVRQSVEFKLLQAELCIEMSNYLKGKKIMQAIDTGKGELWVKKYVSHLGGVQAQLKGQTLLAQDIFTSNEGFLQSLIRVSQILTSMECSKEAVSLFSKYEPDYKNAPFWMKEMGRVFSIAGDIQKSIGCYQAYVNKYCKDIDVNNRYAEGLLNLNRIAEAEQVIKDYCLKVDNEHPETNLIYAQVLLSKDKDEDNDYWNACKMAQFYLTKNPDSIKGYLVLGKAKRMLKDKDGEFQVYKQAAGRALPANMELLILLGNIYMSRSMREPLIEVIQEMQTSFPEAYAAKQSIGIWLCAIGNFKEAEMYLVECYNNVKDDQLNYEPLLKAQFETKNYNESDDIILMAYPKRIKDGDLLLKICSRCVSQNNKWNGCIWLKKGSNMSAEQTMHINLRGAQLLFSMREITRSLVFLRHCMRRMSEYSSFNQQKHILLLKSLLYVNKVKDIEQSIRELESLLVVEKCPRVLILLGHLHFYIGNYAQAQLMLESVSGEESIEQGNIITLSLMLDLKAVEQSEKEPSSTQIELLQSRATKYLAKVKNNQILLSLAGRIAMMAKDYRQAVTFFKSCLTEQQNFLESHYDIPLTKKQLLDVRLAIVTAELEAGRNSVAVQEMIDLGKIPQISKAMNLQVARMLMEQDEINEAYKLVKRYVFQQREDEQYIFVYAQIKLRDNQIDQCFSLLRRCLTLNPEYKEAHELLRIVKTMRNLPYLSKGLKLQMKQQAMNQEIQLELLHQLLLNHKFADFDDIYQQLKVNNNSKETPDMLVLRANKVSKQGQQNKAIAILQQGLVEYPDDVSILIKLAKLLKKSFSTNKIEEEKQTYERLLLLSNGMSSQVVRGIKQNLACCLLTMGQFEQSEKIYKEIMIELEASADTSESATIEIELTCNLSLCFIAQRQYSAALELLQQEIQIHPMNEILLFLLGFAYSQSGEISEAIKSYLECLKIDPHFVEAVINVSILYRKINRFSDAERVLLQDFNTDNLNIAYHRALTYAAMNEYQKAVVFLRETTSIISTNRGNKELQDNRAQAFLKLIATTTQVNVISTIHRAYNSTDVVAINVLLAACLRQSKDTISESIDHLNKCLASDPKNVQYLYSLAKSHYKKGQIATAMELLNSCIQLDSENKWQYKLMESDMLHHESCFEDEIHILKECLQLTNDRQFETIINLGYTYQARKQFIEAAKMFQKGVELKPQDEMARFNLGNALMSCRKMLEAIDSYRECLTINPKNEHCLYNLGTAFMLTQQLSQACLCFEQYVEINPSKHVFEKLSRLQKQVMLK